MPNFDSAETRRRLNDALRILGAVQSDGEACEAVRAQISEAVAGLTQFQADLEAHERHLAHLWENNPQLQWIAGQDEELIWVSKAWRELTGRPIGEALGHGWRHFVHAEDADRYFAAVRDAREAGGSYDVRFRGLTADGSYRWFRTQAVARPDSEGRTEFIYGFTEDIHDQVVAEAALEREVERFRLASIATNDLIWDLDFATGTINWNGAIVDYCDDPETADLTWWQSSIHDDDRQKTLDAVDALVRDGVEHRWQADYRIRRRDASYATVFARGYLLRNEDGSARRMIGAMTDLSARVEAEARIKQLQSELIHVSRLSAMGAMAATLAHELNQPLAAANNWIGVGRILVQQAPEIAERGSEALTQAQSSIARAGEIIRRIRTMLWRGSDNRDLYDIRELIDESLKLALLGATASGIACRVTAQSASVRVDRVQIEQVLLNLVRNAIEAMSDQPRRDLVITAQLRDEAVEVSVSDTGCGLQPGAQEKLFTPFVTTKEQGLGVGLSISRTIVEEHGGTMAARPNQDGGATFTFTLPRPKGPGADG